MAYQQAQIPVQKAEDFGQLKAALERIFTTAALDRFFRRMESKNVSVRQFEKIAGMGLLEEVDPELARSTKKAKQLYESLALSDQALMREFYLERIEKVDTKLRLKYQKLYRYY